MQNKLRVLDVDASVRVRTRQREVSHSAVLVSRAGDERGESDMDACWLIEMFAEIARVFWSDRHARHHARLRSDKPSVPQVLPLRSTPAETT
ncbi:hypothetical protein WN73_37060 [Bradyrhizobium sp. CCBAU 45394]|jgi:hypothetical protein|nr:hypothetical protein [Bradyrhizobium sp. CCBAU 45394]